MWRRVCHPNIVPFLGVTEVSAPLCMVSEWMPNGNVRDYVMKNPESSRLQLVRQFKVGPESSRRDSSCSTSVAVCRSYTRSRSCMEI